MILSEKQLKTLETFASKFFTIADCALVLEVDALDLKKEIKKVGTDCHKAYFKGYLSGTLQLRESIMDLALRGSSPAQTQMLKIREQTDNANG